MYQIELTNSPKTVLVNWEDYFRLLMYNWHLTNGYAKAWVENDMAFMHRFILGLKRGDKRSVDHINGDKLDNRRSNLRLASRSQNRANTKGHQKRSSNASRFKGVYWVPKVKKWRAMFFGGGRKRHLGVFDDEEEAARAYDAAAIAHWGEYAKPNFEQSRGQVT